MMNYITSVSFEDRCMALVNKLKGHDDDHRVLVIDFIGYENVGAYLANRHKLLMLLEEKNIPTRLVRAGLRAPIALMTDLKEHMEWLSADIVLDISTLPRIHLFCISKMLMEQGRSVDVLYYRPRKYGSHLSRGVHSISSLPGFEGNMDPGGSTMLALILGFEGYKSLYAWEAIGPAKTTIFWGEPPFRREYLETSQINNADLLTQLPNAQNRSLHTSDAKQAVQQLAEFVLECKVAGQKDSIVICPLGTKIQALACLALAVVEPNITVSYVSSRNYFTRSYSQGYDEDALRFSLKELIEIAHRVFNRNC